MCQVCGECKNGRSVGKVNDQRLKLNMTSLYILMILQANRWHSGNISIS